MVMLHVKPDIFAGNYRRILELLINGSSKGIEYGTLEINSLLRFNTLLKRLFNYDLERSSLRTFEIKGYGQGYDTQSASQALLNTIKVVPLLLGIKKTFSPDLILVPDALFSWMIAGFIASLIIRKPLIITIQLVPRWIIESGDVKVKSLFRHFKKKYSFLKTLFYTFLASTYIFILRRAYLIVVSKSGISQLSKINNAIFINPNGIRVNKVCMEKVYDACFLGFHDERKGIFDLVEIWKKVVSVRPSATLVTMGGIKEELKERWFKYIESNGLSKNILYLGKVTDAEKFKILSSSKIFLFPSKHELHPISVGEALALGLPVIAYDIPPIRGSYGDCTAVFLCKLGDTKCFATKVVKLLNLNEDEYKELGKKASEFIETEFSWDRTLLREKTIYSRVLNAFSSFKR